MERATRALFLALADYADDLPQALGYRVADDGYAGPFWLEMARAARKLLSMDIGRFDGGTLDALLYDMAETAGFERGELDE
jgi:hypothetical protein